MVSVDQIRSLDMLSSVSLCKRDLNRREISSIHSGKIAFDLIDAKKDWIKSTYNKLYSQDKIN